MLFALFSSFGQDNDNFWDHVRYGGGVGLSFGSGYFNAGLYPSAIYQFNEYVATGVGVNFAYTNSDGFYESTVWGPSVLAFFNPMQEIQLSSEFEYSNIIRNYGNISSYDENYWQPALYLGAGFRTRNVTVGVRYDVLHDNEKSIYTEAWMPFVRVYF
ncbi:alpha-ketoglutarate decarboxylase [Neptunitalea lumnitzerae]|uniref:Alpha-ketoglutarate decarboxylase n=1 Tax=Neptunitalea lumnitzerae TaxID=2965509 RepID=A0ABQ5MN09_9FLAO|nr:alpha-ketoglutarate decarboxylase [Neptunitalea sp. Y10]GLB50737.1 hypothetical protein Y10_31050 [Neptunitalea sp. Y10]